MEPDNTFLEKEKHLQTAIFGGSMWIFRGVLFQPSLRRLIFEASRTEQVQNLVTGISGRNPLLKGTTPKSQTQGLPLNVKVEGG